MLLKSISKCGWMVGLLLMGMLLGAGAGPVQAEPLHFKQLVPLVNLKPPPGWEIEKPASGMTTKAPVQVSQAKIMFRAGPGKTIEIIIMDGLEGLLPLVSMGQMMEMESSEEYIRPVDIQGCKGTEKFQFQDRHGELIFAVANRFMVSLKGEGLENAEILKSLAGQMDLKKLAALAK